MSQSELRPAQDVATQNSVNRVIEKQNNMAPDPNVGLSDVMPIDSYEGEKGFPFAAEYYKLDTPYEFLDSEIRGDVEAIDGFIKTYIKNEKKEDTIVNYAKTLKALEKKLDIDDSMLRGASIKKVANLVKNYAKVVDAFSNNINRKVLNKLIKMVKEGQSSFDQSEYLLQQMGGIV